MLCVYQKSARVMDFRVVGAPYTNTADAPDFAVNQLLYCYFFVLAETSLLQLYREDSSTEILISGARQLLCLW